MVLSEGREQVYDYRRVRKIAKSDYHLRHVCLSVSTFAGCILMKLDIYAFFRRSVEKIQVSLKSDKNNGYFTRRRFHIYGIISMNSS